MKYFWKLFDDKFLFRIKYWYLVLHYIFYIFDINLTMHTYSWCSLVGYVYTVHKFDMELQSPVFNSKFIWGSGQLFEV